MVAMVAHRSIMYIGDLYVVDGGCKKADLRRATLEPNQAGTVQTRSKLLMATGA